MVSGVESFRKILKLKNPEWVDKVVISQTLTDNYSTKLTIMFPGKSGNLYPDISLYIRLVWGRDDVIAIFDFDENNYFSFYISNKTPF
jgi:hypothetical protein